jgi:hypothetical protein
VAAKVVSPLLARSFAAADRRVSVVVCNAAAPLFAETDSSVFRCAAVPDVPDEALERLFVVRAE